MMKVIDKIIDIISFVVIGILFIVLIVFIYQKVSGKLPSIFGYNFLVVQTGSMEPRIHVGDFIFGKCYTEGMTLNVGDVVSYQGTEGTFAGKIITHEIYEIVNEQTIRTYGIANNGSIDPAINVSQIYCIYDHTSVFLSFLFKVLTSIPGFILLVVIPIGYFIVSEIIKIFKAGKESTLEDTNTNNKKQTNKMKKE